MTPFELGLIGAAGFVAGLVNTVVGSGSLITYPVLLALGVPPVHANIANTVGLVPGSAAGAWACRPELAGEGRALLRLTPAAVGGAALGALGLLWLPADGFRAVVPGLVLFATVLVLVQPKIAARRRDGPLAVNWRVLVGLIFLASVYGGYFSAAQGVIMIGLLGLLRSSELRQDNAVKNVLQAVVNLVAAIMFLAVTSIPWEPVIMLAIGSVLGAPCGSSLARRIAPKWFRTAIVVVGLSAVTVLLR